MAIINDMQRKAIATGWSAVIAEWAATDRAAWQKIVNTKPVAPDADFTDPAVQEAIPQQALMMWLVESNIGLAGALLIAGFAPLDELYERRESDGPLASARMALDAMQDMGVVPSVGEWYTHQRTMLEAMQAANTLTGGATPVAEPYVDTYPDPHHWAHARLAEPGTYGMMFANYHLATTFAHDMAREGVRYRPSSNRLESKTADAKILLFTCDRWEKLRGVVLNAAWADDTTPPEIMREMIERVARGQG